MNLAYNIQPQHIITDNADLYLEIHAQGLAYIIVENEVCIALVVYHFEAGSADETVADYIHQIVAGQPVLLEKFNKVQIIYGYSPSILVPDEFINDTDNNALLGLVYGDVSERVTRKDFIESQAIHNIYGIPSVIEMVITRYFESAGYAHLFSLLPGLVPGTGNHLYCIIHTNDLQVLLVKDGKLQAIQNYPYKTQDDAAYYLLSLCSGFDVNVTDLTVQLSGMIEAGSPLYNELYKYFPDLKFEPLPGKFQYPDEIKEYPAHYFSHLFAIAACE